MLGGKEWCWCHLDTGGNVMESIEVTKSECKGIQKKKHKDAGEQPKDEAKKKTQIAAAIAAVASEDDASLK